MATVDLSLIEGLSPIIVFLLVFVVFFAVLAKTKLLGESKWTNLLVSFIVATLFVSLTSARDYVISVTPWFAVVLIILAFVLVLVGFSGKVPEGFTKGLGVVAVILLLVIFLISAYNTFSTEPFVVSLSDWLSTPRVWGAIVLLAIGAITSWVLIRTK